MSRYDLTDFEWRVIEPLLPNKPRGVPRVDDRRVLNGIRAYASLRHSMTAIAGIKLREK
jgi:transposase